MLGVHTYILIRPYTPSPPRYPVPPAVSSWCRHRLSPLRDHRRCTPRSRRLPRSCSSPRRIRTSTTSPGSALIAGPTSLGVSSTRPCRLQVGASWWRVLCPTICAFCQSVELMPFATGARKVGGACCVRLFRCRLEINLKRSRASIYSDRSGGVCPTVYCSTFH